jgi:hypothetical protein
MPVLNVAWCLSGMLTLVPALGLRPTRLSRRFTENAVGSTALAGRLDPEDLREVIAPYHRTVAEIVASDHGARKCRQFRAKSWLAPRSRRSATAG